jgi:hypothetical protein
LERFDITAHLEQEDIDAGATAEYQLDSVVSHAGTLHTGHYITHVRLYGKYCEWRCINNTGVTISSFENVVGQNKKYRTWDFMPVILAYTKVHDSVQDEEPADDSMKKGSTGARSNGNGAKDTRSNDSGSKGNGSKDDNSKGKTYKIPTGSTSRSF